MSRPLLSLVLRCPVCDRIVCEVPAHMNADGTVSNSQAITLGALYCPDHGQLPEPVAVWMSR